ncbi:hypothetical protein [Azospirillum sp.]|uniref:hypothetical protein n=1 Tax=Azospirillum sp. TaxID=34012 RepID=UPI002D52EECD|nr:hypothetical protein [Azospirillum sp.]HYF86184.1 hypothetical protein [Azospirillum sp.]
MDQIGITSAFIHKRDWTEVADVEVSGFEFTIAQHNRVPAYLAGKRQDDDRFRRFFWIEIKPLDRIGKRLGYQQLHVITRMLTVDSAWATATGAIMHKWLCSIVGPIMIGRHSYSGTQSLWAALSRDPDLAVEIVDLNTFQVVSGGAGLECNEVEISCSRSSLDEPFRLVVRPVGSGLLSR